MPTVSDLVEIPLAIFITPATNYCGYESTTKELIVKWFHLLFLNSHDEASKQDNPNWDQAMNGPFSDEYWKDTCTEVETLEVMGDWDAVDCEDNMNVIRFTWSFKLK